MASAVNQCLLGASFGGKYIDVYRGPREDQWIFDDDTELKTFLSMAEYGKEVSGMTYKARNTSLLQSLHDVWDINVSFEREYWDDQKVVKGKESIRYSWCDKLFFEVRLPMASDPLLWLVSESRTWYVLCSRRSVATF